MITTGGNALRLDETPDTLFRQCKARKYVLTTSQFSDIPDWFDDEITVRTAADDDLTKDLLLTFFIRMVFSEYS